MISGYASRNCNALHMLSKEYLYLQFSRCIFQIAGTCIRCLWLEQFGVTCATIWCICCIVSLELEKKVRLVYIEHEIMLDLYDRVLFNDKQCLTTGSWPY